MPKLFSSKEIATVLKKNGFVFIQQRGSHGKFKHIQSQKVVILPMSKRQIPQGTFSSILRQSELKREDFSIIL